MAWQKSPDALVATFHETLAAFPDARVRKMFGYPCAFVGGHMTTGLFEASWFVRTSDDDRDELLALEGAAPFSPMPGRPMTGYVVLPASVVEDAGTRRAWVEGAIAASRALPPKASHTRLGAPAAAVPGPRGTAVGHPERAPAAPRKLGGRDFSLHAVCCTHAPSSGAAWYGRLDPLPLRFPPRKIAETDLIFSGVDSTTWPSTRP